MPNETVIITDLTDAEKAVAAEAFEFEDLTADSPGDKPKTAPRKRSSTSRKPRQKDLAERLAHFYMGLGMIALPLSPKDGALLVTFTDKGDIAPTTYAINCANALDNLAQQSPKVRQILENMLSGGAWGEVVMAHAPLVLAILANHNINPLTLLAKGSALGAPPSDRLVDNGDRTGSEGARSGQTPPGPITNLSDYAGNTGAGMGGIPPNV